MMPSSFLSSLLLISILISSPIIFVHGKDLNDDIEIQWGDGRGTISPDGSLLSLSLDEFSGSGFWSKNYYLFGRIDMDIKLIPGNSAGTVTTFYMSSQGPAMEQHHDEIDFEFLGNLTGDPYTIHTNIFANGTGNKEMQFQLWFDPTADFHTYSILWNPHHIMLLVDDIPIRDFKNHESKGVLFPKYQPMKLYSTLWDGSDWATRGGAAKVDWTNAPFTAYFRNFNADACMWSPDTRVSSCPEKGSEHYSWFRQELDDDSYSKMTAVQRKHMVYYYCADVMRFPDGLPEECLLQ